MEWIIAFLVMWGLATILSSNSEDMSSNSNPPKKKRPKNLTQNLYLKMNLYPLN